MQIQFYCNKDAGVLPLSQDPLKLIMLCYLHATSSTFTAAISYIFYITITGVYKFCKFAITTFL